MEKNARLAFRILASLYPDKKPSEIKKLISDALKKKSSPEDEELWMILTKDAAEEKKEETKEPDKKMIEEHHYYYHHDDYWKPYYTWTAETISAPRVNLCDSITVTGTCDDSYSIAASSDCCTMANW